MAPTPLTAAASHAPTGRASRAAATTLRVAARPIARAQNLKGDGQPMTTKHSAGVNTGSPCRALQPAAKVLRGNLRRVSATEAPATAYPDARRDSPERLLLLGRLLPLRSWRHATAGLTRRGLTPSRLAGAAMSFLPGLRRLPRLLRLRIGLLHRRWVLTGTLGQGRCGGGQDKPQDARAERSAGRHDRGCFHPIHSQNGEGRLPSLIESYGLLAICIPSPGASHTQRARGRACCRRSRRARRGPSVTFPARR